MGAGKRSLKELADSFGAQAEYRALFKEAQLGRQYRKELEDKVVRLCLALELGAEEPVLRGVISGAGAEDLMKLKTALQCRVDAMYPVTTQFPGADTWAGEVESGFMI